MSFSLNHPNIITIEDVLFLLYCLWHIIHIIHIIFIWIYIKPADVFFCVCLVQFFPMKILTHIFKTIKMIHQPACAHPQLPRLPVLPFRLEYELLRSLGQSPFQILFVTLLGIIHCNELQTLTDITCQTVFQRRKAAAEASVQGRADEHRSDLKRKADGISRSLHHH